MKRFFWLLLLVSTVTSAQKNKKAQIKAQQKADKMVLTALQGHIGFLADDKLEGRRTGSAGEKLAYEYISKKFADAGLEPKGENGTFIQQFDVNEGKELKPATSLNINGFNLRLDMDYFPLSCSGNGKVISSSAMAMPQSESVWFWNLKETLEQNKNNPHFDLEDAIVKKTDKIAGKGASALLIYNSSEIKDELKFDTKSKTEATKIPVLYISKEMKKRFLNDELSFVDYKIEVLIGDKKRIGHNVVGYIDNGAATTVIIGAHYDHLGYGEDHNSLYAGSTPMIHNGADDNASGSAALIELSKQLKNSNLKNNNYVFVAFSGEELGLFGSKYYTEHPVVDLTKTNYMINMDMVGRLNDSTHGFTIGGYGTSPVWGQQLSANDVYFKINFDSSGSGPSDHTSFYRKDIPVLFFFTGSHSDYHKPSDDADKINYNGELMLLKYIYGVIEKTNDKGKLAFTKTREAQQMGKRSFSVSMGIMPDYTYSGVGVRADGVSEGKPAEKAGLKTGDIIIQIGEYKIPEIQVYMQTLGKFKKGDATKVTVKRGTEEKVFMLFFNSIIMKPEIRLKYKWIKQRRKEVFLFLADNYGVEKIRTSKECLEDDLGITGDEAYELIQKFEQTFIVDMSALNFTEYFYSECEMESFSPLLILLLKLVLLPFAILVLPFSCSSSKEMLLYNPFNATSSPKKRLTVGDLICSSFTHKFSLQKEVLIKLA